MGSTNPMTRWCTTASIVASLALTFCSTARGQIRSDLIESGFDNTGLVFDLLVVSSDFGELSDARERGATIQGESSVVVFPSEPPFTDIIIASWNADVQPASESFDFVVGFVSIDVTLMKYEARLIEPGQAPVGEFGLWEIDSANYEVSAMVRVVSSQLDLDVVLSVDEVVQDSFRGSIGMAVGDLFLGRTPPPALTLEADTPDLPDGVTTVEVRLFMDAGNTNYRGPAVPALMGDSDLDSDVDQLDYAFGNTCFPDMTNVLCVLHDYDADGVLTLRDFGGFQLSFTGDESDP